METKITQKDQNKGLKIKENQNYYLSIKTSRAYNKKKISRNKEKQTQAISGNKGNVWTTTFSRWKT